MGLIELKVTVGPYIHKKKKKKVKTFNHGRMLSNGSVVDGKKTKHFIIRWRTYNEKYTHTHVLKKICRGCGGCSVEFISPISRNYKWEEGRHTRTVSQCTHSHTHTAKVSR